MQSQWTSTRTAAAVVALAATSFGVSPTNAAYPERPVRMIVPFAPGGAVDVVGRIAAQKLTQRFGQSFFVENIPGATGNIGTAQAAKAPADGHTLLVAFSSHVVNPALFEKLAYDPEQDFAPISQLVIAANVLVVTSTVNAKTVDELVALVRTNPAKFSYAATTNTQAHLLGEQFKRKLSLDLVHVPFNGAGPAIQSVVGGHTPIGFATLASAIGQIDGGQIRAITMLSSQRAKKLPEIPTMAEAGHPDIQGDVWVGLLAPAGTAAPIVDMLNKELVTAFAKPDVDKILQEQGLAPVSETPAQFARRIREEIPLWRGIVQRMKAK